MVYSVRQDGCMTMYTEKSGEVVPLLLTCDQDGKLSLTSELLEYI